MHPVLRVVFLILFTGIAFAEAFDGEFINDVRTTPGCNALVTSSAKLANGDVILGGNFTRCGNVVAKHVVRFNGSQFFSIGTGAENGVSGGVNSVFVDGDKIYVGGHFSNAGSVVANNIAVFEKGQWRSIGEGANNGVSGFVRAIQTFRGQLFVGGYRNTSNLLWAATLKQWDGGTWRNLVEFDSQGDDSVITAFEADQERLYFGGSFRLRSSTADSNLASFDGITVRLESFPILGSRGRSRIRDLHFFQGDLCVAGSFGLQDAARTSGVACRQGVQWRGFARLYYMRALEHSGSKLYAAGYSFETTNNGAALIAIGPTQSEYFKRSQRGKNDYVLTLAELNGAVIIGGAFAQQLQPMQNLMRLQGTTLEPVVSGDPPRLNGPLQQMVAANNVIYGMDDSYGAFAPPLDSYQIHRFADSAWSVMPQPAGSTELNGTLLVAQDVLHFSGGFDSTGFGGLFSWNNFAWTRLGSSISAASVFSNTLAGIGPADSEGVRWVYRLQGAELRPFLRIPALKIHGFRLDYLWLTLGEFRGMPVIVGSFDEMDGVGPVGSVAIYYDNAWHPLGSPGLADPGVAAFGGTTTFEMLEWRDQLYVTNGLTQADGNVANGIARFDGSRWHSLGEGLQQTDPESYRPFAKLIVYQNSLYAYGNFDRAGGEQAYNVARWDGARWHTLGAGTAQGLGSDSATTVQNAAVVNGDLVFSGEIHEAGGVPADFFAIWRGDRIFDDGIE